MTDAPNSGHDQLTFDRAIPLTSSASLGIGIGATVRCSVCHRFITESYHTVNGVPACASCRGILAAVSAPVRELMPIVKALLLGFGAALVGAVIYWAVIRFFSLEIGIVAVLNGWMVGKAMRWGTDGQGGRLLQVAAALLTYLSVGMAYVPLVLPPGASIGLVSLLDAARLPVSMILRSMPGGIISALIIGFGMMQAWQLTDTPALDLEGPFRVGSAPTV